MTGETELQRSVTLAALAVLGEHGFALAGSGAIREHGLVDRPTRDVDLFTNTQDPDVFAAAVTGLTGTLSEAGLMVETLRQTPLFAQLRVAAGDGRTVEMDLGADWRAHDPVTLEVGPVLSVQDAVASKMGALYSRSEARDFLDVDAIRRSGRFTDDELLAGVAERDAGFEVDMFAAQLGAMARVPAEAFTSYGLDGGDVDALRGRFESWASTLRGRSEQDAGADSPPVLDAALMAQRAALQRSFPRPIRDLLRPGSGPRSPEGPTAGGPKRGINGPER